MTYAIDALFNVSGKVALVTGGSSGVGLMIASVLAANGVHVCIVGRKKDKLDEAMGLLTPHGAVQAFQADMADEASIKDVAKTIEARHGRLDILVNNAGASWGASFEDFPMAGWDKVFDLNVRTPFLLTQTLLPLMTRSASQDDFSRVINISSVAARMVGDDPSVAYGPSKAALEQLTRVMARRLGEHRVTANAIGPGWFPSRMNAPLGEAAKEGWRVNTPVGRLGTPEDIGGLVIYLCSRAGMFVNGQVIDIDGGRAIA